MYVSIFFFALSLLQTDSMTIFRCVFVSLSLSLAVFLSSDCPVGLLFPFVCFGTPYSFFFPFSSAFAGTAGSFHWGVFSFSFCAGKTGNTLAMLSFFFRERIYFSLFCWKILSVQTTLAIFFSSASLFFNDCPLGPCMGLFYLPYLIQQSVLSSKHTFFS